MEQTNTHEIIASGVERGVACIVTKVPGGWYCVYWGVPQAHPLHGQLPRLWEKVLRISLTYDSGGTRTGNKQPLPVFATLDTHPERPRWWVGIDTTNWNIPHMAVERAARFIAWGVCKELADYAVRAGVEGEAQP